MKLFVKHLEKVLVVYVGSFLTLLFGSGSVGGLSISDLKSAALAGFPALLMAVYQLVATAVNGTTSLTPALVVPVTPAAQDEPTEVIPVIPAT